MVGIGEGQGGGIANGGTLTWPSDAYAVESWTHSHDSIALLIKG
jgi:hypothetical protein